MRSAMALLLAADCSPPPYPTRTAYTIGGMLRLANSLQDVSGQRCQLAEGSMCALGASVSASVIASCASALLGRAQHHTSPPALDRRPSLPLLPAIVDAAA